MKARAKRVEKVGLNKRVWSVHFECTNCRGKVDRNDGFCRNCGAEMLGSDVGRTKEIKG